MSDIDQTVDFKAVFLPEDAEARRADERQLKDLEEQLGMLASRLDELRVSEGDPQMLARLEEQRNRMDEDVCRLRSRLKASSHGRILLRSDSRVRDSNGNPKVPSPYAE